MKKNVLIALLLVGMISPQLALAFEDVSTSSTSCSAESGCGEGGSTSSDGESFGGDAGN